jgi:hypothetical protein
MDVFLKEYNADESIRKYTKETAGYGINYLLRNDYRRIYLGVLDRYITVPVCVITGV